MKIIYEQSLKCLLRYLLCSKQQNFMEIVIYLIAWFWSGQLKMLDFFIIAKRYRSCWLEEFSARSARKVTTGMTGLWHHKNIMNI